MRHFRTPAATPLAGRLYEGLWREGRPRRGSASKACSAGVSEDRPSHPTEDAFWQVPRTTLGRPGAKHRSSYTIWSNGNWSHCVGDRRKGVVGGRGGTRYQKVQAVDLPTKKDALQPSPVARRCSSVERSPIVRSEAKSPAERMLRASCNRSVQHYMKYS